MKNISRFAFVLMLAMAGLGSACIGKDPARHNYSNAEQQMNPAVSGVTNENDADEKFKVGDQIQIKFSGVTDTPKDRFDIVAPDGTIDLDLIGTVEVAGKTRLELQQTLKDKYGQYYKRLIITVLPNNRFVYVHGQVRVPDRYPYEDGMSVLQAIAAAKGFTDFARTSKVQVTRDSNRDVITVDGVKALEDPSYDVPVYSGDTIYVPRRYFSNKY